MPELPEVETVARGLRERALGRSITRVEVLHPGVLLTPPAVFEEQICGRRICSIERKGKVLALGLERRDGDPLFLMLRLGMTGQVTVRDRAEPLEAHTHVRLGLDGADKEIRFRDARRFGRLRLCTRAELDAVLAKLGPDAEQIAPEAFWRAAQGRRGAIKSWLLNQRWLAGVGNIYADEALYAARIHPLARPGRLSRQSLLRLHQAIQKVLRHAVELQGTSFRDYLDIEGQPGSYQRRLEVYGREGKPCRRCHRAIRRLTVAGRSSHYCPRCQPRPRHHAQPTQPRRAA